MINKNRLLLAAALAVATALPSFSAEAFWGMFSPWNWFGNNWGGYGPWGYGGYPGYGWGGPWGGYGYPGYGWGGPWGGYGYPGYGWGGPWGGYGSPYGWAVPTYTYPTVTAPAASTEKAK